MPRAGPHRSPTLSRRSGCPRVRPHRRRAHRRDAAPRRGTGGLGVPGARGDLEAIEDVSTNYPWTVKWARRPGRRESSWKRPSCSAIRRRSRRARGGGRRGGRAVPQAVAQEAVIRPPRMTSDPGTLSPRERVRVRGRLAPRPYSPAKRRADRLPMWLYLPHQPAHRTPTAGGCGGTPCRETRSCSTLSTSVWRRSSPPSTSTSSTPRCAPTGATTSCTRPSSTRRSTRCTTRSG
jgi:hypothetical protein